ncbi:MAG: N-acetyltransferase [Chitinophagaceae bacterium]|nr:MAG: N-acetyltransferase [Chitinophagaceae bacterium]
MNDVRLELNERKRGAFIINDGDKQLGEMVVSIMDDNLTVYHTEVAPEAEGQGLAKKMLQAMVNYARAKELKVIPLCPYVHAQFKRHPDEYADLWEATDEKE